jgi:hypothetical protein
MCQTKPAETFWEEMGFSADPAQWSDDEKYAVAEAMFERFDRDDNGYVDMTELIAMMVEIDKHTRTFGTDPAKSIQRQYVFARMKMEEADIDHDNKLSKDEFVPFFADEIITKGFEWMQGVDFDAYDEEHGVD